MKRLFTVFAILFAVGMSSELSAQNFGLGGRIGAGLQLQAEFPTNQGNYWEGRFGMSWCNHGAAIMADFTALHQWNVATMNWTPSAGTWFFDAGVGVGVGGRKNYAYVGVAGSAKLGIKFNKVPLRLAVDWSPLVGPGIAYYKGNSAADFNEMGLANLGVSCVYYF